MHSNTLIPISIPTTSNDNYYDIISNGNSLNSLSTTTNTNSEDDNRDHDNKDVKLNILDDFSHDDEVDKIAQSSLSERSSQLHHHDDEIVLDTDPNLSGGIYDNNPPDSFWVSNNKVTDWLNHHTFIERKTSVKLVAVSNKFDPTQTRSSQRSVSFNHVKPQTTIIGFRQKPGHSSDTKSKQNERQDNIRLFKNRSVQVKSSVLHVNEPKSPRVSCIGRVGSMRGRASRTGFWKNVKTAILNRVRANKVKKDR